MSWSGRGIDVVKINADSGVSVELAVGFGVSVGSGAEVAGEVEVTVSVSVIFGVNACSEQAEIKIAAKKIIRRVFMKIVKASKSGRGLVFAMLRVDKAGPWQPANPDRLNLRIS